MLVRCPARLSGAGVYAQPVGTVDVTPTLLGLAGIKHDAVMQGRDLSSQFQQIAKQSAERRAGEGSAQRQGDTVQAGAQGDLIFLRNAGTGAAWVAAIDARYKLVLSVNDRPWLFDGEGDPDELLNFLALPQNLWVDFTRISVAFEGRVEQAGPTQDESIVKSILSSTCNVVVQKHGVFPASAEL